MKKIIKKEVVETWVVPTEGGYQHIELPVYKDLFTALNKVRAYCRELGVKPTGTPRTGGFTQKTYTMDFEEFCKYAAVECVDIQIEGVLR